VIRSGIEQKTSFPTSFLKRRNSVAKRGIAGQARNDSRGIPRKGNNVNNPVQAEGVARGIYQQKIPHFLYAANKYLINNILQCL